MTKLEELLKLCDQAISTGEANQDVKYTLYFGADVFKALIEEVLAGRGYLIELNPSLSTFKKIRTAQEHTDQILEKMR